MSATPPPPGPRRRPARRFRPAPEAVEARVLLADPAVVVPVSGVLAPWSDSAVVGDDITNVSRPVFFGRGTVFAVVQLSAVRAGTYPTETRPLGQAIVGADGSWTVDSAFLPDGAYTVLATQTLAGGSPGFPVPIVPNLVIDTVAPRVAGFAFAPQTNLISVVISDAGAGLDASGPNSPLNPANYTLVPGFSVAGFHPNTPGAASGPGAPASPGPVGSPAISGVYTSAMSYTVYVDFRRVGLFTPHGRLPRFQVASGGIADRAGNPLDGEFTGRLPSGDGVPGGNFIAQLVPPRVLRQPSRLPFFRRPGARG